MNKSDATPRIRISYHPTDRVVYISKSTLRCLNDPPYIRLLYVAGKNLLVIEGHNEKVKDSIAVSQKCYDSPDKEFRICRKILTEAFRTRLGWDEGVSYRTKGKYSQELGVVVFNLERATKIGIEP